MKSNEGQTTRKIFRPSNIELLPNLIVLNSTDVASFLCINHQSDDLPLMSSLSKKISKDSLKRSSYKLNKTAIRIDIELKNYLGIFHLFCYAKNKKNEGTVADVIVKTEPGLIKLHEQCRVYDRQYIKCIFHAPTIARAIQNDFPSEFKFTEITNRQAYSTYYEFLKNESNNESLVFKWIPTVDGEFPNEIIMNMSIKLPYFTPLYYRFDMNPIFVIKPNFVLNKLSKKQIQIQLTPISSPAICEQSIIPQLNSNITQTWTIIESIGNITISDNLLFDTSYQICIRCRQTWNDPHGIEECQKIRTSKDFPYEFIVIIIISCVILLLISGLIYYRFRRNRPVDDLPVSNQPSDGNPINDNNSEDYKLLDRIDYLTDSEPQTRSKYKPVFPNDNSSIVN